MNLSPVRKTVFISTFTAMMVLGVFIRVPVGPVPIVMTNLFILLAGYLLGPVQGTSAVALYLFLGALGLPVFSAGGGIALFIGPTGGYLAGYLPAAAVTGMLARYNRKGTFPADLAIFALGALIIYLPGASWLKLQTGLSWSGALQAGILPFLPGDVLKICAAAGITRGLGRTVPELFPVFENRTTG